MAMSSLILALGVSLLVRVVFTCQPPDCDHPDCGSCGNACCHLEFKFAVSPGEVYQAVVSNLKAGGADKNYSFVNSTDKRKEKLPGGVLYTLQGTHTTTTPSHLSETLNMVVTSPDPQSTILQCFSISQVEGAYCDGGQNYKNLVGFIKGLSQLYAQKVVFGCANATSAR